MDIVIKSVMLLRVIFADPESDGSFNYLLDRTNSATERQYSIAHSYPSDMGLKPGDEFYALVEAKCSSVFALDPTPKGMEDALPWGVPRTAYICNADAVTINGVKYISLVR